VQGAALALFQLRINPLKDNLNCGRSHVFHGLPHRCKRRRIKHGGSYIIESDHRTLLRNANTGLGQGANRAERAHVIKGEHCGEGPLLTNQIFCKFLSRFKARHGIARLRQFGDQARVNFQLTRTGTLPDATPAGGTVGQRAWSTNKCDFSVPE